MILHYLKITFCSLRKYNAQNIISVIGLTIGFACFSLLSVTTLACILIAVFGIYSLTSLTCQQRRKEISICKINGAEALDIMNIFFKEYLLMLAMATFVAYPTFSFAL